MSTLEIRTARLVLTQLRASDAPKVAAYYLKNRDHLAFWEPARDDGFFAVEQWADRLEKAHAIYRAGSAINLALIEPASGEMIGSCNFSNIIHGVFQACNLGYSIAADREGKGLMREAVSAGIAYVFDERGLHRIMANHLPDNHRSAALLLKLGFEREGYAKSYLKIAGKWQDHVLNSLINPAHCPGD
jgi:[ribosomal protein S5]-alanine N-acetyltransferase